MNTITTRFDGFLNEGMIKLPPRVLEEALKFFNFWALAHILAHGLKKAGKDEDEQQLVMLAVKKVADRLQVKMPTKQDVTKAYGARELTKRMKLANDVPKAYVDRISKRFGDVKGKKLLAGTEIGITIYFKKGQLRNSRAVWDRSEESLFVSLPNCELDEVAFGDLSNYNYIFIGRKLHVVLGIIEHELTHGIQDLVLRLIHPEQAKTNGKSDKIPFEKPKSNAERNVNHHLSAIEFDPLIKSSVRQFRVMVETERVKDDLAKTKELFHKFTTTDVSRFFSTLRKHDEERWKKAVKLAWGEYERKYL